MSRKDYSDKHCREIPAKFSIKHGLWKGKNISFRSDRIIIKLKTPENFQREDEKNLKESIEKITSEKSQFFRKSDFSILSHAKAEKGEKSRKTTFTRCFLSFGLHCCGDLAKNRVNF